VIRSAGRYLARHHVALLALFVALGGTSVAATKVLAPSSVGTAQLKPGAVVSSRVRDHSLLRRDFRQGQLPRGRPGVPGPAGTARAWGVVDRSGRWNNERSHELLSVNRIATGVYCIALAPIATRPPSDLLAPTTIVATLALDASTAATIRSSTPGTRGCPATRNVFVVVTGRLEIDAAGTLNEAPSDQPFYFAVP
jgi:hypothetical protein